ncbi:hypothetical protein GOBAR_AA21346 [Gossypium barbadense]|uniref:Uncharacterized protein n=1 Tax=Gossypium barbadense TaxID=3634 RepID=A0A2P5X7L5_GOSBA|nr:hypothetical protein GOBAR_AA21346 [Gossypium barbadense]
MYHTPMRQGKTTQTNNSETRSKSTHEPCSSNDKGPIYEEQRLRVKELDEWQTHKPRTHDKPKPCHDEPNISPNQLKVGDKVLLDAVDPRIATSEPNGEISLTVLNIFPYGTINVIYPKFDTFKGTRACPTAVCPKIYINSSLFITPFPKIPNPSRRNSCPRPPHHARIPCQPHVARTPSSPLQRRGKEQRHPWVLPLKFTTLSFSFPYPGRTISDTLGPTPRNSWTKTNSTPSIHHIHYSPSKFWQALVPASATYDPISSKASALDPSLSYKELKSSSSPRNSKLHWQRFSTTAMSCSTTTIATTRYNILLAQDFWTNEPLPPPEYPPPLLSGPWPIILYNSNSKSPFIIQEVSLLSLSYDLISISS